MLQKMQLVRSVGIATALALTVVVSGCGGGSSNKNEAVVAKFQLGQSNFQDIIANRNDTPGASTLSAPASVATNGHLFVIADTNNNRIIGFNGVPTSGTATATFQYGQSDLTSNTQTSLLSRPTKVAFSNDGAMMLVADSRNNRILIWTTLPTSVVGASFPSPDITISDVDNTTPVSALKTPTGASFLGNDGVVVADGGNNRVLIYPTVATGMAATVVLGQRNFTSGAGQPNCPQDTTLRNNCAIGAGVITADTLSAPYDVWSDGGSLLISDQGNNRVLSFITLPEGTTAVPGGKAGQLADAVIGQTLMTAGGPGTGGSSVLKNPRGLWVDPLTSYIYVADAGNNRVLAFQFPFGNGLGASAVYGQGDYAHSTSNDDNQNNVSDLDSNNRPEASNRTVNGPQGMTTYSSPSVGNLVYVADTQNSRVIAFPSY